MSAASRARERERAARIENKGLREERCKYYDAPPVQRAPSESYRFDLFDDAIAMLLPVSALVLAKQARKRK